MQNYRVRYGFDGKRGVHFVRASSARGAHFVALRELGDVEVIDVAPERSKRAKRHVLAYEKRN